jgi:hypothetical protein
VVKADDPESIREFLLSIFPPEPTRPPQASKTPLSKGGNDPDPEDADASESGATGFEDWNPNAFTPLGWRILEVARRLGEPDRPHASASVRTPRGLDPSVRDRRERARAHRSLARGSRRNPRIEIRKRLAQVYPLLRDFELSFHSIAERSADVASTMNDTLRKTLELARRLAAECGAGRIGARHLLGAAVRREGPGTSVGRFLRGFG